MYLQTLQLVTLYAVCCLPSTITNVPIARSLSTILYFKIPTFYLCYSAELPMILIHLSSLSVTSLMTDVCSCYLECHRVYFVFNFYRAMHYSAKRGLVNACRLSVCDGGGS